MLTKSLRVEGSAVYTPKKKLYSNELDKELGLEEGTVFNKSGVRVRSLAAEGETQSQMAKNAAFEALQCAGMKFEELDVLVCANGLTQQLIPCNAALLQREMGYGNSGVACFDVNSTCLGFITALDMVSCAFAAGRFNKAMIVVSDISSVGINWKNLESASLFGDAAAAFVLKASDNTANSSTILSAHMKTFADAVEVCEIKSGGFAKLAYNYTSDNHEEFLFSMDGPKVFKIAAQYINRFVDDTLAKAGYSMSDVDHVIPHQASKSAMELIRRRLNIPESKLHRIIENAGNCVAASLPMAFHDAIATGRLQKGQTVLLLGTGAGVSFGAILLRY